MRLVPTTLPQRAAWPSLWRHEDPRRVRAEETSMAEGRVVGRVVEVVEEEEEGEAVRASEEEEEVEEERDVVVEEK